MTAPNGLQLQRVDYDEPGRALLLGWDDGVVLSVPFAALRLACPCAICCGEMGRPGRFDLDPVLHPGEDELAEVSAVGAYALGIRWADGHSSGIHTYEQLRALGEGRAPR